MPPGRYGKIVKQMDSALKSAKTSADSTLYRGMDSAGAAALNGQLGPGSIVKDLGFSSTSSSETVARSARSFQRGDPGGLMMEIHAAAGSRVASLSAISESPGEHEMLLPRGSSFRITGYDASARVLSMELL